MFLLVISGRCGDDVEFQFQRCFVARKTAFADDHEKVVGNHNTVHQGNKRQAAVLNGGSVTETE